MDYIATSARPIDGVTNKRQNSSSIVKIQLSEPNNVNGLHQTNMILKIIKSGMQHLILTTISSIGETRQSLLQKNYYPAVLDLLMMIFPIKM
jgi:hypothetical protein